MDFEQALCFRPQDTRKEYGARNDENLFLKFLALVDPTNGDHQSLVFKFWSAVKEMLTAYKWKNRAGNGFGLLDIDLEIIKVRPALNTS